MTDTLQCGVEPRRSAAQRTSRTLKDRATTVSQIFADAGIAVLVAACRKGTAATLYEMDLAPNVNLRSALGLRNELAAALGVSRVCIVFGLPDGRVGLLVPNQHAWA